ncbi:zinc-binding dehydrogenase [Jeotgalibaca sp. MA1X17-3]|uniref:zinc-binding dehydrogenase n=1 Tax=Jeotgalibaca sp. MA1X17-3 TaxID=2908211 RepID=UPI001F311CB7|nr:zinc-binding dehydrogenase [Jeotgalibaca sp. MA1X17-3]UJF16379.1 zinc-binding dehydrogenase [Jeotgalibaca sp. MA1X17-3]
MNPNWKKEILEWKTDGVDAALAIQSGTAKDSMDVVKKDGKVITVSGDHIYPERNILVKQFQHQLQLKEIIKTLAQEVMTGEIKVMIEHIYPFEEANQALEKNETRHARGKLVVSL